MQLQRQLEIFVPSTEHQNLLDKSQVLHYNPSPHFNKNAPLAPLPINEADSPPIKKE